MASAKVAPIVVSNHIGIIEPIYFSAMGCSHVAKADVAHIPLVGRIAQGLYQVSAPSSVRRLVFPSSQTLGRAGCLVVMR